MLHYVMGVNAANRPVGEWKLVSQISPHVAFAGEHVRVQIDPSVQVFPLSGSELDPQIAVAWSSEISIRQSICGHQWASDCVKSGFELPGEHVTLRTRTARSG